MIKARLVPARTSAPRDMMVIAREILTSAIQEREHRRKLLHSQAASRLWKLRRRLYFHAKRQAHSEALKAILEKVGSDASRYKALVEQANRDCLAIALTVAKEVLRAELHASSDSLSIRIAELLVSLLDANEAVLLVHPDDHRDVSTSPLIAAHTPQIRIIPSPLIERGNALLETPTGKVPLKWHDHFDQVSARLKSRLEEKIQNELRIALTSNDREPRHASPI